MAENSNIEWCDHTWSPWRGYTKVSPGCANCYAEKLSHRNPAVLGEWGKGRPRVVNSNWRQPIRWSNSTRGTDLKVKVFPSMCDWLDEEVPVSQFARFARLIYDTPGILWMLLTKRPEAFFRRMKHAADLLKGEGDVFSFEAGAAMVEWMNGAKPSNVWMGTSVEDQERADERIPHLLRIPAVVRWLSVEPLIGPINLEQSIGPKEACPRCTPPTDPCCPYCIGTGGVPMLHSGRLNWVVIGGESGKKARPCAVSWVESLIEQCKAASVPVFVKQLGARPSIVSKRHGIVGEWLMKHPKGGDPEEWPECLRVREWPKGGNP